MKYIITTFFTVVLSATPALAETAPPPGFTSAMQKTGEVKLHYVRDGGAGETVILLHGFPQTWSSWKK